MCILLKKSSQEGFKLIDTTRVRVKVINATFNSISVISWRSFLLVEETGVPGENHRPEESHWQTWSHMLQLDSNSQL